MELDFADFHAIVALAETLHFGRAANRLHVSQPALSKRVRRIEDRIGGPLLVRRSVGRPGGLPPPRRRTGPTKTPLGILH